MLKEILALVLTVLPNWISLVFSGIDRYRKWKNKRSDGAEDKEKPGGNRA